MRVIHSADSSSPDLAVDVAGCLTRETPVMLVHGMGSDHTTWAPTIRTLRATCRPTVAVDLRGHGRSGRAGSYRLDDFASDIARVADELGLESFDLVGHSLGAHAALRFAMSDPTRIRRLVLEELPPMPRDDADVAERIAPSASLGERIRGLRALAANPVPFLRFDRALGGAVAAQFETPDPRWWADLAGVDSPTLVISGGDRSFLPSRHLRSVAATLPDADFVTIEAGHSVHRDAAPAFLSALLAHLVDEPVVTELSD